MAHAMPVRALHPDSPRELPDLAVARQLLPEGCTRERLVSRRVRCGFALDLFAPDLVVAVFGITPLDGLGSGRSARRRHVKLSSASRARTFWGSYGCVSHVAHESGTATQSCLLTLQAEYFGGGKSGSAKLPILMLIASGAISAYA
jgi:hypothetical protein